MRLNPAQYTLLISSCDRYADLWEGNLTLLRQNWPDQTIPMLLVTDHPVDWQFPPVRIFAAGQGREVTDRLRAALQQIHTPYVILVLEDYFFTQPIEQENLCRAIAFLEETETDYLQLYPLPRFFLRKEGVRKVKGYPGIYMQDLSCGNYKVALTPGIWRKTFLEKTLQGSQNIWQYEVSLTETAWKTGARCATSNRGELPYLDVIRKGKVLRKAHRYFQKHPVYQSQREVLSRKESVVLWLRWQMKLWLPNRLLRQLKKWMLRRGMTFYSPLS